MAQLVMIFPFSVAVTHVLLSSNVMVISVVYVDPLVNPEYVGGVLSIRVTVAVVDHVFPIESINSKVNNQFPVKVYKSDPQLFVIVIPVSENPVSVAITDPLVKNPVANGGLYVIVAVGGVVFIVNVEIVVFPALSLTISV